VLTNLGRLNYARMYLGGPSGLYIGLYTNDVDWNVDTTLVDIVDSGYGLNELFFTPPAQIVSPGYGFCDGGGAIWYNNTFVPKTAVGWYVIVISGDLQTGGKFPHDITIPAQISFGHPGSYTLRMGLFVSQVLGP